MYKSEGHPAKKKALITIAAASGSDLAHQIIIDAITIKGEGGSAAIPPFGLHTIQKLIQWETPTITPIITKELKKIGSSLSVAEHANFRKQSFKTLASILSSEHVHSHAKLEALWNSVANTAVEDPEYRILVSGLAQVKHQWAITLLQQIQKKSQGGKLKSYINDAIKNVERSL